MSSYYEKILATGEVKCIDEEIPFEIPNGWEWCRMQDVITFVNGRAYKKEELLPQGKYKVLRVGNFFTNNEWYYSDLELPEDKYCYNGDLLYAWSASFGPQIWNGDKTIFHYHIWNVKFNSKILFREYLYYFFLFDKTQVKASTTGSTMVHVSMENMKPRLIPIPPVNEQKRIVHEIENIIPLIERYGTFQNKKETLDSNIKASLKKSILQEAIQGNLVPQITEEGTAQELLEQIKAEKQKLVKEGKLKKSALAVSTIFRGDDNKYYEQIGKTIVCIDEEIPFPIPNNWAWSRLSSMCSIVNGFTPLRSESKFWDCGTINWFTVEDIKNQGEMIYSTKQKITDEATSKERIVRAGSVLLCCTASVGQCALAKIDLTTNQQFNALTVKDVNISILTDNYLFWFAKTLKPTLQRLSGKTTFEFVSVKKVGNILIPIPPFKEQQRIVAQIEKLFEQLR